MFLALPLHPKNSVFRRIERGHVVRTVSSVASTVELPPQHNDPSNKTTLPYQNRTGCCHSSQTASDLDGRKETPAPPEMDTKQASTSWRFVRVCCVLCVGQGRTGQGTARQGRCQERRREERRGEARKGREKYRKQQRVRQEEEDNMDCK